MHITAEHRHQQLIHWLTGLATPYHLALDSLTVASSDASFRRYYRIQANETSYVVMDAPPSQENNTAFIDIQHRLAAAGLKTPEIIAYEASLGFMLLSDLGTQNYYHALHEGLEDTVVQALYRLAIDELVRLQQADHQGLPIYTAERMLDELQLFEHWYLNQHCQTTLSPTEKTQLDTIYAQLVADNQKHGQVLVHRDFHSPNLMMPTDASLQPGVIDFQDAVVGPLTYDIASLVMDARYTWDEDQQIDWAVRYWQTAHQAGLNIDTDFARFHQAYEWMSVQRNLRILGVFSRLSIRDQKHHYLDHIPRVVGYLRQVFERYELFDPLSRLFDRLENKQRVLGMYL